MIIRLAASLFLLALAASAWSATGPRIPPCEGCPVSPTELPYPRAGMWYDPARDGTGMNLEVQNGVAVGTWHGFDQDGLPMWYQFAGDLAPMPEGEDGYWQLEAPLAQFVGGNCIDCPYRPSEVAGVRGMLRLKVIQRNLISYQIDGGEEYRMLPLVWGTPMPQIFPEVSDHGQPMVPPSDWASPWAPAAGLTPWTVTLRTPIRAPNVQYVEMIGTFWLTTVADSPGMNYALSFGRPYAPGSQIVEEFLVRCGARSATWPNQLPSELDETLGHEPMCIARQVLGASDFKFYVAPLADVGDDYVRFTATDGAVIEGARLLYR
jgi:hypothetical protein